MLDHYLNTAYCAGRLLEPHQRDISLAPPQPGVRPEYLTEYQPALAWFATEHHVLLAAVRQAASAALKTTESRKPILVLRSFDRTPDRWIS